jgi:aldose 1-epimerase
MLKAMSAGNASVAEGREGGAPGEIVLELGFRGRALRARVDAARGAGLIDLVARDSSGAWRGVIARDVPGEDARANPACFFMVPWCNRVRDASFVWGGRRVDLRPDGREPHAMHGDVRKRAWSIVDRTPVSASLAFDSLHSGLGPMGPVNFPWAFSCLARYELATRERGLALRIELVVTSCATEALPVGAGIHPYFPRVQRVGGGDGGRREVQLAAPVRGRFPSERCMPTGPARRDAVARWFDGVGPLMRGARMESLTGYRGVCVLEWPGCRATMTSSPEHGQMVYFAPHGAAGGAEGPSPFIAVEPMTVAADGFNMLGRGEPDHGVVVLEPGESLKLWHEVLVETA